MSKDKTQLMLAFDFTTDDLMANQLGKLTPRQAAKLLQSRKMLSCSSRAAIIAFIGSGLFFLLLAWLLAPSAAEFSRAFPYVLIGLTIFYAIAFFFLGYGYILSSDLRRGKVSMSEGVAEIFSVKIPRMGTSVQIKVNEIKFTPMSERQLQAIHPDTPYRIYYIKNPNANIVLSIEII